MLDTFTMRSVTASSRREVSRKGAATLTAHVISSPSCGAQGTERIQGMRLGRQSIREGRQGIREVGRAGHPAHGDPRSNKPSPPVLARCYHTHLRRAKLLLKHPGVVDEHVDMGLGLQHLSREAPHTRQGGQVGDIAGGRRRAAACTCCVHCCNCLFHARWAPARERVCVGGGWLGGGTHGGWLVDIQQALLPHTMRQKLRGGAATCHAPELWPLALPTAGPYASQCRLLSLKKQQGARTIVI